MGIDDKSVFLGNVTSSFDESEFRGMTFISTDLSRSEEFCGKRGPGRSDFDRRSSLARTLGVKFLELAGDVLDGVGLDGHRWPRRPRPAARKKPLEVKVAPDRSSLRSMSEAHLSPHEGREYEGRDHEDDDHGEDGREGDPERAGRRGGRLFASLLGGSA